MGRKSTSSLAGRTSSDRQESLIDQGKLDGKIKVLADVRNPDTCLSVRISPNGKYFAVALANGKVHLFSAKNEQLIYRLNDNTETKPYSATAARFHPWGAQNLTPNKILTATFTDGSVKTYDFPSLKCIHKMNEGREILACEYSKSGNNFATSGCDGNLRIYDDETRQLLIQYAPPFYENARFRRIYAIVYHPQNTNEFITGGWDNVIRYYDLRIPELVRKSYGPHICGEGLSFSPSGSEFCSASWRKSDALQIWDYGSSKLVKTLDHSGSPGKLSKKPVPSSLNYCCKYFSDSEVLVGGTSDDAVSIVNTLSGGTRATINDLGKSVYSADCHQSRIAFVAGPYVSLIQLFE